MDTGAGVTGLMRKMGERAQGRGGRARLCAGGAEGRRRSRAAADAIWADRAALLAANGADMAGAGRGWARRCATGWS